jgi:flagellar motor switch protein FliN/FliY
MSSDSAPGAWLAAEFASGLGRVLESMAGETPTVECGAHEISAADFETGADALLWWEQPLTLSAEALVWVGAKTQNWEGIGARVLRAAGVEEIDQESSRATYLEIVTQTLSGIAGAVSGRAGREIACGPGSETAPAPAVPGAWFSFRITFADSELVLLAAFHNTLATLTEQPPVALTPTPPPTQRVLSAPQPPHSMDLLLDVELPVSISFGRAQLPLKDVIKLTTGSIVELNRSVTEPVEVIVNNCVIARGEVVVVEGNFGIRIKQVISRQERLRTLN